MTLTTAKIANAVKDEIGFFRIQRERTIKILLKIINNSRQSGGDVLYSGFGKF